MKFTKIHGLGNDYLYINLLNEENQIAEKDLPRTSRYMSNRNFGIGADGIILIEKSQVADFKMRIFNQDGTEAEMCGNGIRGFGKYVYDYGLTNKKNITVETLAGIKQLVLFTSIDGKVQFVEVNMGKTTLEQDKNIIDVKPENGIITLNLKINNKDLKGTYISIGNPHFVIFEKDIQNLDIKKYGKIIENDKHFPNKINVEFAQIIDRGNIKMRVWERGSRETFACGTGACCVAMISNIYGYTRDNVKIHLKGGTLDIKINKKTREIYMTGITTKVFDGIISNNIIL